MEYIKKIIIVQHQYASTTPKTQRMLAAAKEYVKLGTNVVFIISTDEDCLDCIEGIRFIRIEEKRKMKLQCFMHFVTAIKREYNEFSIILFYGIPVYAGLFSKKKYRIFAEVTEIPHYGKKVSLIQKIFQPFRDFAVKNFSGMFVISNALKDYFSTLYGIKNIEVINMFVDASRFALPKSANEGKFISYCGRISYYKDGVNDLIQAFKLVHERYPGYKLKIIGAFENDSVEADLKKLVTDLCLVDSVVFTGLIGPDELPYHLVNSEILALARPNNVQAQYGFPTKLGEYLSTGNPVVVTAVGEIPMYIKHLDNGLLAKPGDPTDFSEKLLYLIEHPEESKFIGIRGKQLTLNDFSAKIQTEKAYRFMKETVI